MEAEKSHNLLSASWRTGKPGGVIQKGLGERERRGEGERGRGREVESLLV